MNEQTSNGASLKKIQKGKKSSIGHMFIRDSKFTMEFLKCLVQYSVDSWGHSFVQREFGYQPQLTQTKDRGFSFNICQFENMCCSTCSMVQTCLYYKQFLTKVCKWFACIILFGRNKSFVVRPGKRSTDCTITTQSSELSLYDQMGNFLISPVRNACHMLMFPLADARNCINKQNSS